MQSSLFELGLYLLNINADLVRLKGRHRKHLAARRCSYHRRSKASKWF